MFWLDDLTGTGKSTVARTIPDMNFEGGDLGAGLLNLYSRGPLRSILPPLASQPAHQHPRFQKELPSVLTVSPGVGGAMLFSQMEKFIILGEANPNTHR